MTVVPEDLGRLSRWSDRLNPILVREVQQSLKGRAFIIVLSLALASIVVTALVVAAEGSRGPSSAGREYFTVALVLLVPIVVFLIPIQAFLSMQQELKGGAGEQLLLSRLTPRRIVHGKLTAAMVQVFLFLSVFGPLMALTFVLRGVDVPTIAFFLVMAVLTCLVASAFAIALGALGRVKLLSSFMFAITATALGGASTGLMSGMWFMVRDIASEMRHSVFWIIAGVVATGGVISLVLFGMVARSLLTHPNENRSSGFRLLTVGVMAVAVIWIVSAVPTTYLGDAGVVFAIAAPAVLALFWLFAVTEEEPLSPRTRILVPKSRILALLSVPFLPGGGRGALFMLVSIALVVAISLSLRAIHPISSSMQDAVEVAIMCGCYGYFYAGLGRVVRARLPRGVPATWLARLITPVLLVLGCLIPVFLEIMSSGHVGRWSPLHLSNPFWTLERIHRSSYDYTPVLLGAAAVVLLLQLPSMARGIREVMAASAARRNAA